MKLPATTSQIPASLPTEIPLLEPNTKSNPNSSRSKEPELRKPIKEQQPFKIKGRWIYPQRAGPRPFLSTTAIFSHGIMVAWHCSHRVRSGPDGCASVKVSCPLPLVKRQMRKLGENMECHGAWSADVVLPCGSPGDAEGPREDTLLNIHAGVLEPVNARLAGVDLVGALTAVSSDQDVEEGDFGVSREGVQSYRIDLVLLAAAKKGRVAMLWEVWMWIRGWKGYYGYKGSVEEMGLEGWLGGLVVVGLAMLLFVGGEWLADFLSERTGRGRDERWSVVDDR